MTRKPPAIITLLMLLIFLLSRVAIFTPAEAEKKSKRLVYKKHAVEQLIECVVREEIAVAFTFKKQETKFFEAIKESAHLQSHQLYFSSEESFSTYSGLRVIARPFEGPDLLIL
jgi:hypothetical protein